MGGTRAHCGARLERRRSRARGRGLWAHGVKLGWSELSFLGIPALSTVFEPEAFAVHFQNVDMMSQPVEERACEAFRAEDAGPFIERQV